jgi:hypothetical protein
MSSIRSSKSPKPSPSLIGSTGTQAPSSTSTTERTTNVQTSKATPSTSGGPSVQKQDSFQTLSTPSLSSSGDPVSTLGSESKSEKAPRSGKRPPLIRRDGERNLRSQISGPGSPPTTGPGPGSTTSGIQVSAPAPSSTPTQPQSMSYSELNKSYPNGTPNLSFGDYQMFGVGGHGKDTNVFAEFYKKGTQSNDESTWKAHLSIDPNDLAKAWDTMTPLLEKHGITHFKVVRQNAVAHKGAGLHTDKGLTDEQRNLGMRDLERVSGGMQVTVYIPEGQEKQIQGALKDIEKALKEAGVRPGTVDQSDRQIGTYSSVRNDGGPQGYVTHDKVESYNPSGEKDPFKKI